MMKRAIESLITCSQPHHLQSGDVVTLHNGTVLVVEKITDFTILTIRAPMRWWHVRWFFIYALAGALGFYAGYSGFAPW